jgi:hypothetical protein
VPALVVCDHPVVLRQRVEMVREVLFRASNAVQEEQSGSVRIAGRGGREAHSVVGRDPHHVNLRRANGK